MRQLIILSLAAMAATGAGAGAAHACKCGCSGDVSALLRSVPIVFRGRPIASTVDGETRRYTFEVEVVYKGDPVKGDKSVITPLSSAACGAQFDLQRSVLVGVSLDQKGWSALSCTQYCIDQMRDEVERLLARCKAGSPCPPEG